MKTLWTIRTLFVVASLAVGTVCTSAHAQHTQGVSVNVPFGFEIGSRHMAPGKYEIMNSLNGILEIRSDSDAVLLLTYSEESSRPTAQSKLVFDRYGDHYFLRQVWFTPNDNTYAACGESNAERKAKRAQLEATNKKASNVEVATLRIP